MKTGLVVNCCYFNTPLFTFYDRSVANHRMASNRKAHPHIEFLVIVMRAYSIARVRGV
jgi:hypothetical protein